MDIPVEKIGIYDDFFKLGGDSILSIQLKNCINKDFNIEISIKYIFMHKSIDSFSKQIASIEFKSTSSLSHYLLDSSFKDIFYKLESYLFINEDLNDSSDILFLFPPSEGGAECYLNNLAKHIKTKKLVLFNNFYHFLKDKLNCSYEMLAKYFIQFIKTIQPNGPYNFFGWCFGGNLDFEITNQLILKGDKINKIFLLDTFFMTDKTNSNLRLIDKYGFNFLYLPIFDLDKFLSNVNSITLFKVKKLVQIDLLIANLNELDLVELENAYKYFTLETNANNLDILINETNRLNIKILSDNDHNSWVNNLNTIEEICNYL